MMSDIKKMFQFFNALTLKASSRNALPFYHPTKQAL